MIATAYQMLFKHSGWARQLPGSSLTAKHGPNDTATSLHSERDNGSGGVTSGDRSY